MLIRGIQAADLVVRNAVVHTLDQARPRAEALAVSDGRIAAVGGRPRSLR